MLSRKLSLVFAEHCRDLSLPQKERGSFCVFERPFTLYSFGWHTAIPAAHSQHISDANAAIPAYSGDSGNSINRPNSRNLRIYGRFQCNRGFRSQRGGREFDPPPLHHSNTRIFNELEWISVGVPRPLILPAAHLAAHFRPVSALTAKTAGGFAAK